MRVEFQPVTREGGQVRLSGVVDACELFWEVPAAESFEPRGEPFVCALLPVAMRKSEELTLPPELPIDPAFRSNIQELQRIFARWFPGLVPVPVHATIAPRQARTSGRATGYSGGIDSSYTLDALARQLDAALLIDGIEYRREAPALFGRISASLEEVTSQRGIPLVVVRTNVKEFGRERGAAWSEALGGAVASCAHAVGFADYQIAASNSWENLRPYGSHPITDPLWSSAGTHIAHHGTDHRRIDKIEYLRGHADLLAHLRVCFQGIDYNCGTCQKCLLTMAGLRAVGVVAGAVPSLTDPSDLRRVHVEHDGDLVDWEELLVPGLEAKDPALHRELSRLVRHYRWRSVGRTIDALVTNGALRRLLKRQRGSG